MKDFVRKERRVICGRGGAVQIEYRERRDGRRAQVVVDQLPVEEGLPGRMYRRYHGLIAVQRRQEQTKGLQH